MAMRKRRGRSFVRVARRPNTEAHLPDRAKKPARLTEQARRLGQTQPSDMAEPRQRRQTSLAVVAQEPFYLVERLTQYGATREEHDAEIAGRAPVESLARNDQNMLVLQQV